MSLKFKKFEPLFGLLLFIVLLTGASQGQDILFDEYIQIENLTLFRSYDNELAYYYLPNRPHLALNEKGEPEFSFLKYAQTVKSEQSQEARGGIQEATGGGVVHFLVTYDHPEEEIRKAEKTLQKKIKEAKIVGPIIFQSGTFGLVTSLNDDEGSLSRRIVGIGKAPLIEGNKAAISMDLTQKGASLLWESFQMANPDISLVFEMEVLGYRNPYQATVEVDWANVYKNQSIKAGLKILWIGADIDMAFKELRQEGTIKITAKGQDQNMEALVNRVHSKLLDIMFDKVEREQPAETGGGGGFWQALGMALSGKSRSGQTKSAFSLFGGYQLKNIKQSGKLFMDLNQYSADRLTTVMAGNIGDLYQKYGQDPRYFRAANLDDPVYNQREIFLMVDGRNEEDFKNYINFVTVQILKEHQNGEQTLDETVIDKESFSEQKNRYRMVYGWKQDSDRQKWMTYKYKTVWNFYGGASYESPWSETDSFVLSLTPPYQYRRIFLEGDRQVFEERGIRHALVKFYYDFFGKEMTIQKTIKASDQEFSKVLEYSCPSENFDYSYEIVWYLKEGGRLRSERLSDSSDIIYIDELPDEKL
jgi:hypothetical protein